MTVEGSIWVFAVVVVIALVVELVAFLHGDPRYAGGFALLLAVCFAAAFLAVGVMYELFWAFIGGLV